MRLREMEGFKDQGKLDAFRADWHYIKPDPDNDLRDLTTPENRAHIERLKESISKIGVRDPILIRVDEATDTAYAVDGKCRLIALAELEAEGRPFPPKVTTLQEPRGTERKKRMLTILSSGKDRKNLSDAEFARGLYRAIEFGYSEQEVCDEMGWASLKTLHNHLDVLTLKPELREMVSAGKMSRTEAVKLQKKTPDADPGEIMRLAEEEHKRLNKKGPVKAKPRHVKQATKKPEPAKAPEPPKPEPTPAPIMAENAEVELTQAAAIATDDALGASNFIETIEQQPAQTFTPLSDEAPPRPEPMFRDADELKAISAMQPPPASHDFDRALFDIVARIAQFAEGFDLNEIDDAETLDCAFPIKIFRDADRLYRERIGDTTAEAA